ncbi:uncharacterized protein CPUR_06039 [Claviceps purpurea 20.1]|uniref:Uncharacterized protein n=1 Tax=Claviceps purpurea (strain 20.1) TaxID=1111077 RepID=M1WGX6_CLAP2|nr:uncharacterized protein CPUR_06039 [Claviceps purpurea 20.1]
MMTLPLGPLLALLASLSLLPSPTLASTSAPNSNSNANPSPTIPVLFFGDKFPMAGSVIASDTSAVTLAVKCPTGLASEECGLPSGGVTITQGSRAGPVISVGTENCKLDPVADAATCTGTANIQGTAMDSNTVLSGYKHMMYPVTITAGAEKLAASGDGGASAMLTTGTATATATGTATVTSTRTNAAGAMVTQNAAVLAGVVAVVGGVLAV